MLKDGRLFYFKTWEDYGSGGKATNLKEPIEMHRYEARILDSDGPNRFDLVPTDNPLERKWALQVPPALRPLPSHPPHCLPTRPTVQRSVQRSAQYTVHTPCTIHRATRAPCARLQAATPSDMACSSHSMETTPSILGALNIEMF